MIKIEEIENLTDDELELYTIVYKNYLSIASRFKTQQEFFEYLDTKIRFLEYERLVRNQDNPK